MTKKALIVEDEIFVALDLERILTDSGYEVAGIAADSEAAYQIGKKCDFALVDINLRDGATGPQIAERLTHDYGVKVVFVTANPGQIVCRKAAIGYVRKPFREEAITAAAAFANGEPDSADDDLVTFTPRVSVG